jgi:hypothetical protein
MVPVLSGFDSPTAQLDDPTIENHCEVPSFLRSPYVVRNGQDLVHITMPDESFANNRKRYSIRTLSIILADSIDR